MKTLIRFSQILLVSSITLLVGCSSAPKMEPEAAGASGATGTSGAQTVKQYPMHGKIVSVDVAAKKARIDADAMPGFMGAMTMDYKIKDDAGLAKLTPGMEINATENVLGEDDDDWVTDIKPVTK